jgi:hypothetical protein
MIKKSFGLLANGTGDDISSHAVPDLQLVSMAVAACTADLQAKHRKYTRYYY